MARPRMIFQGLLISFGSLVLISCLVSAQAPSDGEGVILADLQSAVVELSVVRDQVILNEGRKVATQLRSDVKFSVRGNRVEGTLDTTTKSPKGTRRGDTKKFIEVIEVPNDTKNFGPGSLVWFFKEGKLIELRVFERGGAFRREVSFARSPKGLTCTATEAFARENGTGAIKLKSGVDGAQITVVSSKQVSSTCRIAKSD